MKTSQPVACSTSADSLSSCKTSLGIFLSESLREYDTTRNRPGGVFDRLSTILLKKAFINVRTEVRGNVVAADALVEALVRYADVHRCCLFVHPWFAAAVRRQLNAWGLTSDRSRRLSVHSLTDLIQGIEKYDLTAWFNPLPMVNDGVHVSHRIRNNCASAFYPVTLLAHGLSNHRMLYEYFLRLILEGSYPCDSLICSSTASSVAARGILSLVCEQFNRQFKTELRYEGRIDVIPLCIDTTKLRPQDKKKSRAQFRLPQDSFVILSLGRISPLKADLHPFLQVFRTLVQNNPNRCLFWVIAGSQENGYVDLLGQHARELGIAANTKLLLEISDEQKAGLIGAADVFFGPADSCQESFGLAPIEAMACGVPQIVADWDGYRDTVPHGKTGFLIPTYWTGCTSDLSGSGAVLSQAYDHLCLGQSVALDLNKTQEYMQCLVDNESVRRQMGDCSRQRALNLYSYEAVAKRYSDFWSELSSIAVRLRPATRFRTFDQPFYALFNHYASALLSDETAVRITTSGMKLADCHAASDGFLRPYPSFLSTLPILDGKTLLCAVQYLASVTETRMKELILHTEKERGGQVDRIRRHVMWLIKYGYIEPVPQKLDGTLSVPPTMLVDH